MKTNQLMKIAFSSGEIEVFHKTAMGNLTQLWSCGNRVRMDGGKSIANLSKFLTSNKTKDFISVVEKSIGENPVVISGRGNTRKTWANIHMMIYAAEYLSPELHFEVIDTFISGKILSYRDESGDNFKAMNIAIDNHLPERQGKDNKGLRIQVAKRIKEKVSMGLVSWNFATADELKHRSEIEDKITSLLYLDLIKNYEHLKDLIDKL